MLHVTPGLYSGSVVMYLSVDVVGWSALRQLGRLARADLMVSIKASRAEPDEDRERGHGGDQVDDLAVQHAVRFTPQW